MPVLIRTRTYGKDTVLTRQERLLKMYKDIEDNFVITKDGRIELNLSNNKVLSRLTGRAVSSGKK